MRALSDPTAAWQEWLVQYNITYSGKSEADFRRQVWLSNLQRAGQLNQMVGREVAVSDNHYCCCCCSCGSSLLCSCCADSNPAAVGG